MRTVVFGYHNIGRQGLDTLLRHNADVVAVFTHRDDPTEALWFDSVAELAADHGIPVFAPDDVNHALWVNRIRGLSPDFIFSFFYRKLLSSELLDIPNKGAFNLHGSLLPKYRGRCPVNWAILNGERETGVTLHEMTVRPDAGAIVGQHRVSIDQQDDATAVFAKLVQATDTLLDRTLPAIREGRAPQIIQDESKATYFGARRPADGEIDWSCSASSVANLVRAVTRPYPGAFSFVGDRKVFIWAAKEDAVPAPACDAQAGSVLSTDPLRIACDGESVISVLRGEVEGGVCLTGRQLAQELSLYEGARFGSHASSATTAARKQRILILGVNGFIGSAMTECLLDRGGYEVFGMDLASDNLGQIAHRPGFEFREGDISVHREWIEYHIRKCDVVLPLVAIATPIEYVRNPIRVFELDFEENLRIIRHCVRHNKRVVFPSTSEVYGMCEDKEFNEDSSHLTLGPIRMQRWIYSCSKQLLDRVIWAYGEQQGLHFSLFRPFNWIGPRLDSLESARIGSSRAITQLILNLVEGSPILLVDGGRQKRCFTDVSEGVECLARIIDNKQNACDRQIINIGNPVNEASIRELAEMLVEAFDEHPLRDQFPSFAGFREIESAAYYGKGYQDVEHRRPSIRNAQRLCNWTPNIPLGESVRKTLDFFLAEHFRANTPDNFLVDVQTKSSSPGLPVKVATL